MAMRKALEEVGETPDPKPRRVKRALFPRPSPSPLNSATPTPETESDQDVPTKKATAVADQQQEATDCASTVPDSQASVGEQVEERAQSPTASQKSPPLTSQQADPSPKAEIMRMQARRRQINAHYTHTHPHMHPHAHPHTHPWFQCLTWCVWP